MYLTYTRHKVKDYATWRKAFDENTAMLTQSGITDWWVVQINGNPTDVAVIVRCQSKEQWDGFVAADREKIKKTGIDPRAKGGLVGQPEWWGGEVM